MKNITGYKKITLSAVLLLSGCFSSTHNVSVTDRTDSQIIEHQDQDTSSLFKASGSSLWDGENISASFVSFSSLMPTGQKDAFWKIGTSVQYCDPSISDTFMYYCFNTGCLHNDLSCNCYIGNADLFLSYRGYWYYDRINSSNAYELICHDPSSNNRKIIAEYEMRDDGSVSERITGMSASYGKLYVNINRQEYDLETGKQMSTGYYDVIDLKDGSHQIILENDGDISLFGVYQNKAVILKNEMNASVNGQLSRNDTLLIYDLQSEESVYITDTDNGFRCFSDSYQLIDHENLVYINGQKIHILNLENMDDQAVYTSDGIISRAWFFGRNIRLIEKDDTGKHLSMISADGTLKEQYPSLLDEAGIMVMGYSYSTEHGQIGSISNGNGHLKDVWISEQDLLESRIDHVIG